MGRRDAVQVALEVHARMRQLLPTLVITYEPDWMKRGNGTTADYEGGLVHHTGPASSERRPFPSQRVLRDGRPDLPGPLCNEAVPWCTTELPRLHVVAAHPANHAGASGGRSMGPLPVTRLFNPKVRGLEIDYAGSVAMTAGQWLVGLVWARANADVVGGGDIARIRAHFETSVTGKWDIGAGAGRRSVDMGAFRREAATITAHLEDVVALLRDERLALFTILAAVKGEPIPETAGKDITLLAANQRHYAATAGTLVADAARAAGNAEFAARAVDGVLGPEDAAAGRHVPLVDLLNGLRSIPATMDTAKLVGELLAGLAPQLAAILVEELGDDVGLTADQVEAASERATRRVFAGAAAANAES
ncbi:hypothetical protein TEK04_19610 [Klenkia sp. LSe6-5]|uniref:Uncharacterized protein n=1 Tax=Klenkia sesuvii TaxID=3103137 RepID=A0ABU8E0W7_9ACTN